MTEDVRKGLMPLRLSLMPYHGGAYLLPEWRNPTTTEEAADVRDEILAALYTLRKDVPDLFTRRLVVTVREDMPLVVVSAFWVAWAEFARDEIFTHDVCVEHEMEEWADSEFVRVCAA